ncbi:hypothetical protein [Bacillus cereus]|uniref:hypothetical protein n=2 Tax=Bacillus cereus TaxID=1396 RepID=UPI00397C2D6D
MAKKRIDIERVKTILLFVSVIIMMITFTMMVWDNLFNKDDDTIRIEQEREARRLERMEMIKDIKWRESSPFVESYKLEGGDLMSILDDIENYDTGNVSNDDAQVASILALVGLLEEKGILTGEEFAERFVKILEEKKQEKE